MDYSKLRGRIREVFHTEQTFADAMEMSPSAMSARLNGRAQWTGEEIARACNLLGLSNEDYYEYFFTPLSCEK